MTSSRLMMNFSLAEYAMHFTLQAFYFLRTPSTVYDTCRINLASRFLRAPYVGHEAPVSQDLDGTVYMHVWLCKKYPGFSLLLDLFFSLIR